MPNARRERGSVTGSLTARLLVAALLAAACGCAPRQPPRVPAPAPGARARLEGELERVFSDRGFAPAQWGVSVVSLDRGDLLFQRNASKLYLPA
jgi:hypothetical protein